MSGALQMDKPDVVVCLCKRLTGEQLPAYAPTLARVGTAPVLFSELPQEAGSVDSFSRRL